MIDCNELELDLPLLVDGQLDEDKVVLIEEHLPTCPLCRDALDDFRAMKFGLAGSSFHPIDTDFENQIKLAVSEELSPMPLTVKPVNVSIAERINHWLMPMSVGTFASALLITAFFLVMLSELRPSVDQLQARELSNVSDLMASNGDSLDEVDLDEVPFASTPPEINPTGALVALTNGVIRGEMKDEEVVLVADVFGNGIARIAGVVEGADNEDDLRELQKAFEADPAEAPFLPTKNGATDERVRFVFKIHTVEVGDQ